MLCTRSANPLSSQSFFHDLCLEVSLIRIWTITFRHVGLLYRIVIYNYNNSNFRRSKGHLDVKGQILQHAVRIQILSICSLPDKLSFQTFIIFKTTKHSISLVLLEEKGLYAKGYTSCLLFTYDVPGFNYNSDIALPYLIISTLISTRLNVFMFLHFAQTNKSFLVLYFNLHASVT